MTATWQASVCPPTAAANTATVRSRRGGTLSTTKLSNFIGGSPAEPKSGTSSTLLDPSTGEPNFEAPVSGAGFPATAGRHTDACQVGVIVAQYFESDK